MYTHLKCEPSHVEIVDVLGVFLDGNVYMRATLHSLLNQQIYASYPQGAQFVESGSMLHELSMVPYIGPSIV